jgi:hypothetical protein
VTSIAELLIDGVRTEMIHVKYREEGITPPLPPRKNEKELYN